MEYDRKKVDEAVLALLWLTGFVRMATTAGYVKRIQRDIGWPAG